jgi:hypothetical protein
MNADLYDDPVPDPPAVYLHVGPPKTGTTYLQDVLWLNQARLAERGVTVLGKQVDHFHAALDLRGISFGGYDDPAVPGAWARLAARAREASGKVVISHEVLAGAQPEQIAEAVSSLAPATVHVVYAARDLGRQLPAVWQEGLKNRQTRGWAAFLNRSLHPDAAVDRGFWRSQHAVDVLARWAEHVPADRIRVVTLPPADAGTSGGDVLWERFCQALGIDGSGLDLDVARTNASLSAAQCEVLRMLNQALPDDLAWPAYEHIVKRRFNDVANAGRSGRRTKIPGRHRDDVLARAEQQIEGLGSAGYPVIGDLDDLRPRDNAFGRAKARPARVTRAAVQLLAAELELTERHDSVGRRARTLMGRIQGRRQGSA